MSIGGTWATRFIHKTSSDGGSLKAFFFVEKKTWMLEKFGEDTNSRVLLLHLKILATNYILVFNKNKILLNGKITQLNPQSGDMCRKKTDSKMLGKSSGAYELCT